MEDKGQKEEQIKELWWKPAIMVSANTSAWIVGPIIIALILGKYLDSKYGTSPRYFLILIIIAFVVTVGGIYRLLRKYLKKL